MPTIEIFIAWRSVSAPKVINPSQQSFAQEQTVRLKVRQQDYHDLLGGMDLAFGNSFNLMDRKLLMSSIG